MRTSLFGALAWAALLATESLAHGDFHDRIQRINAEIEKRPEQASLYIRRAQIYRTHGDWSEGLADLGRAEALDTELRLGYERGTLLLEADRLPEAEKALRAHLRDRPASAPTHLALGRALVAASRAPASIQHFDLGIAGLDPPRPAHYLERARAQRLAGGAQLHLAVVGLEEGLERLGPLPLLQRGLIEAELARGASDAALWRVNQARATAARQERWLFWQGEILEGAGRPHEALESYRSALDALDRLPAARRETASTRALRARIAASLGRLRASAAGGTDAASPAAGGEGR